MKLAHRLLYYLGGFAIGLILLFFFLGGKKTSCNYGPNARVLKNIRLKKRVFSNEVKKNMRTYRIDTADISYILKKGKVDFSKSNTNLDSCKEYQITGKTKEKNITLRINNCDSVARITHLYSE